MWPRARSLATVHGRRRRRCSDGRRPRTLAPPRLMFRDQRLRQQHPGDDYDAAADGADYDDDQETEFRDIPALTPPSSRRRRRTSAAQQSWDSVRSQHTSTHSVGSDSSLAAHLGSMHMTAALFGAMVTAGNAGDGGELQGLLRIGEAEEDPAEDVNPLAIVPDHSNSNLAASPPAAPAPAAGEEVSVVQVKKEEVETKIAAWQTAEIAKINNRFKREEVFINGWEADQVEKATAALKKTERKLEEKRAKAVEKAQNEVARARRKAEEKRASAEAARGTKAAGVLELASFMRAVGRAPSKRTFF